MKREQFTEAKSRSIQPVRSVYDFQPYEQILIKSGDTVTRKIVRDINFEANSVVATDAQGGSEETIYLDPNSPAKDGAEFKYWIDEGKRMTKPRLSEEDDLSADDLGVDDLSTDLDMDDLGVDDLGVDMEEEGDPDDMTDDPSLDLEIDDQMESDDEEYVDDDDDDFDDDDFDDDDVDDDDLSVEEAFSRDLRTFLREEDAPDQVPNNTVGGGVDDTEYADNDGEGTEDPPAPHDTTGMEDADDVDMLAGDPGSNEFGEPPTDEVETHGEVGGPETIDDTLPVSGEHEPGTPDKSESVSEAVRQDVQTALSLVYRGANPTAVANAVAPRLLRGAPARS